MKEGEQQRWIGFYTLNAQGEPVVETSCLKWSIWMGTADRRVALTEFAWGCVSTLFLGLDYSFLFTHEGDPLGDRPVLWETKVFGGKLDQKMCRYKSREDALAGHREIVEKCLKNQPEADDRIAVEIKTGVLC
jgi:hypothetical protein